MISNDWRFEVDVNDMASRIPNIEKGPSKLTHQVLKILTSVMVRADDTVITI